MAIRKRKTKSGFSWGYYFDAPGSTRGKRVTCIAWGFASKKGAMNAEAERRIVEQSFSLVDGGAMLAAPRPLSLGELLEEFCKEHAERNLAPKTVVRYREYIAYLPAELKAMSVEEITPLQCTREWNRLRDAGGHDRKTKTPRPLSVKSVRSIASFLSSAFVQGIHWGFVKQNPVTASKRPRGGDRREAVALTPVQQRLLLDASTHWVLPAILEVCAGLGARRGEVLALRWSDVREGQVHLARSLSQAAGSLVFKGTKTGKPRIVTLPVSTAAVLESQRARQVEFREQYGADYQTELDLVFCNPDGSPLKPDSISGTASALCRKLKLPRGVSLHALRHSHGSQLLRGGMELTVVSARLGHSSPHVTAKIYAHVLDGLGRDQEAARVWEAMQVQAGVSGVKQ